jgi:hypothetical protein
MLNDPLILPTPGALSDTTPAASAYALPLTDPGSVAGRSSRSLTIDDTDAIRLDLARSETKESKPYGTIRFNGRLSLTKVDDDGNPVTAFSNYTSGFPKSPIVSVAELNEIEQAWLTTLLYGDDLTNASLANGDAFRARIRAGEL